MVQTAKEIDARSDAFFIFSVVSTELAAVGPCEKEKKWLRNRLPNNFKLIESYFSFV